MNMSYMLFACVISIAFANYTIFTDGSFKNNWYEQGSTCFASQTGKFDGRYILYTQMATDSYLNLIADKPLIANKYKYLTFAINWEDQFCNLRIKVEVGSIHWLSLMEFEPEVLETQKWNRIVIDISSLGATDLNIIRITKNDQKDTNVMFNDFMFTNDIISPGVFEYEQTSIDVDLDGSKDVIDDGSMPLLMALMVGLILLLL